MRAANCFLLFFVLELTMASSVAMARESTFSHDDWAGILSRFVDEAGRVDYNGLAVAREPLQRYTKRLAESGPRSHPEHFPDRNAELAYFINGYNALVFQGVLDRGPEQDSVWKGGLISGYRFFVGMRVVVDGEKTNLRKLENQVIRAEYQDPRIHAALNCASVGCPRLPQEPFWPDTLDEQLDAAMREFVTDSRQVHVIDSSNSVELSKIFDWFASDFTDFEKAQGNEQANLIDYVNRYRSRDSQIPRDYKVKFLPYDKSINKQP